VEDLENYSRRNNVIIHGIPIQENENPLDIAVTMSKVVGVDINYKDIDAAHRLPSLKNKVSPPFIMRLINRTVKSQIIINAKNLAKQQKLNASLVGGDPKLRFYYSEHLSKKNQEILNKARCLWNNYIIYTHNGKVMGRPKEGGRRFTIESLDVIEYYKNYNTPGNSDNNLNPGNVAGHQVPPQPGNQNMGIQLSKFQFNSK